MPFRMRALSNRKPFPRKPKPIDTNNDFCQSYWQNIKCGAFFELIGKVAFFVFNEIQMDCFVERIGHARLAGLSIVCSRRQCR
jgi:hypothetical protein